MKAIFRIAIIFFLCLPLRVNNINAQENPQENLKEKPQVNLKEAENTEIKEQEVNEVKVEEPVKRRIKWEDAEGAIEYKVQISNPQGKIIINNTVAESSFNVELPHGEYRIRIGAVNKFGKIGSWSDWANITLEEEKTLPELTAKAFITYSPMHLKIDIGPSFFQLLPGWDNIYKNSYNSTTIHAGAAPLDLSYFRYTGIELESTFTKFKSKSKAGRINTRMTNIITGLNLYAVSWFDFPVNFIFRLGGGFVFTEQEYEKFNSTNIHSREMATLESADPYYKAGLSVEYRVLENLYLEAGADFYLIRYLASDLKGLKYFIMIGTGL